MAAASSSISILMPVYNGIEFLDESVGSVLSQTYPHWELIIGVNGHPAGSPVFLQATAYAAKDRRIRVVDLPFIRGKSAALNHMLTLCRYEWVALLDVDDVWLPDKLAKQMPWLGRGYDVVGTRCVWFGERPDVVPSIPVHDISAQDFFQVNPIINSSSVTRRSLCGWNAAFEGVEDYDLWLRLRKRGCRFYNCPDILVRHRIHHTSAFNAQHNHLRVGALLQHHQSSP